MWCSIIVLLLSLLFILIKEAFNNNLSLSRWSVQFVKNLQAKDGINEENASEGPQDHPASRISGSVSEDSKTSEEDCVVDLGRV